MTQAVLDHLWQSTLFVVLTGLLTLAFRRNRAHIRFGLWLAASVKFLIPFALFVELGQHLSWRTAEVLPEPAQLPLAIEHGAAPVALALPDIPMPAFAAVSMPWDFTPLLWAVWACGAVALLLRWAVQLLRLRRVVAASALLEIDSPVPVRSTRGFLEPGLFGIFWPVLLLPEGIAARLAPAQFAAMMAHELAHWWRRDNLTAAIHMLVEALFWFHPLVWWLGARLVTERERACDEAVIRSGSSRQLYAEAILKICQFQIGRPTLAIAGMSGGENLQQRIEFIMTHTVLERLPPVKKFLLAAAGCAALAGPIGLGMASGSQALAQGGKDSGADAVSPGDASAAEQSEYAFAMRRWEQAKPRKAVPIDSRLLEDAVGYYRLDSLSYIAVTQKDGHLFVQLTGQPSYEAFLEGGRDFFLKIVSAQLTFAADRAGPASSVTLHQNGGDQVARRADEASAKAAAELFARRIKEQVPLPGTEASLRRLVDQAEHGVLDYAQMNENVAQMARQFQPEVKRDMAVLGALQSIDFAGVAAWNAWDVYALHFANGYSVVSILLDPAGKIDGLNYQRFNEATRLPVADLGTIDSKIGTKKTTLEFLNKTDERYRVYWKDFDGSYVFYGDLQPHQQKVEVTFDTHVWVIGKDPQHPVAAFVAPRDNSLGIVD